MKNEIVWFNDKLVSVYVCIHTLDDRIEVPPHTYSKFHIDLKDGESLFIKHWDYDTILISGIDAKKI